MSTYEQGVLDALTAALRALDGHGFHDTAHDRIRRLLACDECGHQPEKHGPDGVCLERVMRGPGLLDACQCIEYEVPILPLVTASRTDKRPPDPVSDAKGGSSSDALHQTNRSDLVTRPETH